MTDLVEEKREELSRRQEFSFGGIVVGVRTGQSKTGNPYGIVKMEDFEGTGELALFGKSWLEVRNYFVEGTPLFVRARYVPRRYNDKVFDLNILSVDLLSEIKESAVHDITINITLDKITDLMVEELSDILMASQGKSDLYFNVKGVNNMRVNLISRQYKINVDKAVLNFLNDHKEEMEFSVNTQ